MGKGTGVSLTTYKCQTAVIFQFTLCGPQSSPWFAITASAIPPLCTCFASLCKELSRLVLHYHGRLFNEDTQEAERKLDYDQAMCSI